MVKNHFVKIKYELEGVKLERIMVRLIPFHQNFFSVPSRDIK